MERYISAKYRNEKSLNGYSLDVLKSALQKYIRRGLVDKAIYSGNELSFFECVDGGGRIYTNYIHRLMIIMLEDIGLSLYNKYNDIDEMFMMLTKDKKSISKKKRLYIENSLIITMCLNKHERVGSHFNAIYNFINNEKLSNFLYKFPNVKIIMDDINIKSSNEDDIVKIIRIFKKSVKNNEKDCFYWAKKIDDSDLTKAKRRDMIFDTLYKYWEDERDTITILKKWYNELSGLKERFLTYYMVIIKHTNNININNGEIYSFGEFNKYAMINIDKKIEFDEYVYDQHTKIGKRNGKSTKDFVNEGIIVENEEYRFPELKKFYIFSKLLIQEGILQEEKINNENVVRKESDMFEFIVRSQLNTSHNKQDTYFAVNKETGKICFVKGPFLDTKISDVILYVNTIRNLLGLKYVKSYSKMLIPDLLETPLGTRTRVDKDKEYLFMIYDNLCDEKFNTEIKSSKMWKPTEVVNWKRMKRCKTYNPLEDNDVLTKQYIEHLLFRKIVGIADLADRNFMNIDNKWLYSVDEDVIDRDVNIFDNIKKQRTEKIKNYIENNRDYVDELLNKWREILKSNKYDKLVDRLDDIDINYF